MLNTRLYFAARYISMVLKNRRRARKNRYDSTAWAQSSFDILQHIENCGGRFHITGLENLHKCEGPVIFASNHMSTLESMVLPCIISPVKEVTFVVKRSLVENPLFGPVMRSRNPVVVNRGNSREDLITVLREGQKIVAGGRSIIIFPQGTRKQQLVPEEFNSLAVKLAGKAGVPVIPIALKTDFWGNGKYIKELGPVDRKKPVYFHIGEPVTVSGNGKAENQKIIAFIAEYLEKWEK